MKYGFGIDVGGTTCKMGLFKEDGTICSKWEITTRTEENGKEILPDLAKEITKVVEQNKIRKEEILGIGMGVPGPVNEEETVLGCVNLGWPVISAGDILKEMTGLPVRVGNDANVAAMGELWRGSGRGVTSLVMITLGTGVGGGIIHQGKMMAGNTGAGGEIGHLLVNPEETQYCNCGRKGCLEQYASATGIVNMAVHMGMGKKDGGLTAKDVFKQADEGNEIARKVVERVGDILGKAMANIAVITDPEIFLLGGGVSKAGESLLNTVRKGYVKYAFRACRNTRIELASLGNDAGIYGAVRMLLDRDEFGQEG